MLASSTHGLWEQQHTAGRLDDDFPLEYWKRIAPLTSWRRLSNTGTGMGEQTLLVCAVVSVPSGLRRRRSGCYLHFQSQVADFRRSDVIHDPGHSEKHRPQRYR